MKSGFGKIGWALLALLGAFCLGTVALRRGESINALWIVIAAVSICSMIPAFVFVGFAQRHIVSGLASGAVK